MVKPKLPLKCLWLGRLLKTQLLSLYTYPIQTPWLWTIVRKLGTILLATHTKVFGHYNLKKIARAKKNGTQLPAVVFTLLLLVGPLQDLVPVLVGLLL